MRVFSHIVLAAALVAATGALAAPKDRSVSSDGKTAPAPTAEANVSIKPSLGKASATVESASAEGAVTSPPSDFPANGLGTVAYGAGGAGPESIIGWDSRRRVYTNAYPSRAIVFIEYNGAHLCTGWMYSPSMVATAGHCVHTGGSSGAFRTRSLYKVYAGRDGTASPFGSCTVARLWSVAGWTGSKDPKYDYGAMRLNCTIGNTVGWFGMYSPSPVGVAMTVSGYPGDKPRDQWTSSDKIREASDQMISYRADTIGGHSGSPVWTDKDEGTATNGAWSIGIHNYGAGTFGNNANSAARLTSVRIQNLISWRDAP